MVCLVSFTPFAYHCGPLTEVGSVIRSFEATWFTPAGIDILSRDPTGLSPEAIEDIKKRLLETEDPVLVEQVGKLFEVARDNHSTSPP